MTVQIEVREETATRLQAAAETLKLSLDDYLARIAELVAPPQLNGATTTPEELDPQGKAMLAVLERSAERLKDSPVSGETKDTLEMIRRARAGEMWGIEPKTPQPSLFETASPEERARAVEEWASRHRSSAPPLSDEAISRDSIYGEREDNQL